MARLLGQEPELVLALVQGLVQEQGPVLEPVPLPVLAQVQESEQEQGPVLEPVPLQVLELPLLAGQVHPELRCQLNH